jgi:uncharacterized protein (TIGR02268 family)
VCADEPTTFVFDSLLPPRAVELLPDNRSLGVAQGDDFVTVNPRRGFLPGERVKVTVRFADGAAPASATFWLVGHGGLGARRVAVFRQPRPPDVLRKERDEAQAEARQCQEDKARLLAERQGPGGLMGAAWLAGTGSLASKELGSLMRQQPTNAPWTRDAWSYSYTPAGDTRPASVAVGLHLQNPGAEPWALAGAALVDSTGEQVELAAWQQAPIPANNGDGVVVVGIEGERAQLGCPCTLKLWEARGPRTVTLRNVIFPVSQKAAPSARPP